MPEAIAHIRDGEELGFIYIFDCWERVVFRPMARLTYPQSTALLKDDHHQVYQWGGDGDNSLLCSSVCWSFSCTVLVTGGVQLE